MPEQKGTNPQDKKRGRPTRGKRRVQEVSEFDQRILDLARVTRVTAGGKRMRFRVCLIAGDRKGRVGYGVAKGADVQAAVEKAFRQAKKRLVKIPFEHETIPFPVEVKYGSAHILLKPAPQGTGLKAGGAIRVVFELAGVPNASAKILGASNKINNVKAVFLALHKLNSPVSTLSRTKGKTVVTAKA